MYKSVVWGVYSFVITAQRNHSGNVVVSAASYQCRQIHITLYIYYRCKQVNESHIFMKQLIALYNAWSGIAPTHIETLPGAGSNRVYYRFFDSAGNTVIGVVGTSREENHAFIYLTRHFKKHDLPVPQILAVSDDEMRYLQTDLGNCSLFDALRSGREAGGQYDAHAQSLLVATIRLLPKLQLQGAQDLDWSQCYPQPVFDETGVFFDLNYFKYCFLKPSGIDFHEMRLEEDFRLMAKDLVADDINSFLYRDFQARNVMMDEAGNPFFIDYQGGRRGPYYYDLASFLWQASAHYSPVLRHQLISIYYEELRKYTVVPSMEHFSARLALFVLFRTLQVLGAYGFRGHFERKPHFLASIPFALHNLREQLQSANTFPYPYLIDVLKRLTQQHASETPDASATQVVSSAEHLVPSASSHEEKSPLVVRVFSFSYRKGIPDDESGNGGGYVFDCRAVHNPGRYEPYKQLTGLDEPVIRFLEDDGEILTFLENVYKLADMHVARYIKRGFTSLMFSFGCTGGQHRSVYCAQHLALHLHEKFGIEVRVCHREQQKSMILKKR